MRLTEADTAAVSGCTLTECGPSCCGCALKDAADAAAAAAKKLAKAEVLRLVDFVLKKVFVSDEGAPINTAVVDSVRQVLRGRETYEVVYILGILASANAEGKNSMLQVLTSGNPDVVGAALLADAKAAAAAAKKLADDAATAAKKAAKKATADAATAAETAKKLADDAATAAATAAAAAAAAAAEKEEELLAWLRAAAKPLAVLVSGDEPPTSTPPDESGGLQEARVKGCPDYVIPLPVSGHEDGPVWPELCARAELADDAAAAAKKLAKAKVLRLVDFVLKKVFVSDEGAPINTAVVDSVRQVLRGRETYEVVYILGILASANAEGKNSMLQVLTSGKPDEVEAAFDGIEIPDPDLQGAVAS